jgi:membrane protease YdiL (CAAX protease family)
MGALLIASRRKGAGRLADDFGLRVERRDLVPGVLLGLASQFVLLPLLYLPLRLLDPDLDLSAPARRLTGLGEGWGLVVLGLCVVVGSPLVEELFFRGLLLRSLARRFGPAWGVALSALAFGAVHAQPLQFLGLVAFGVVLGLLAQRSGRLGPALVAHAAFNAATFAVLVASR